MRNFAHPLVSLATGSCGTSRPSHAPRCPKRCASVRLGCSLCLPEASTSVSSILPPTPGKGTHEVISVVDCPLHLSPGSFRDDSGALSSAIGPQASISRHQLCGTGFHRVCVLSGCHRKLYILILSLFWLRKENQSAMFSSCQHDSAWMLYSRSAWQA